MTDAEREELERKVRRKLSLLYAAGITNHHLIEVAVVYIIRNFKTDEEEKEQGHAQEQEVKA